jgi:DNA-binding SARP family transcriptional activator
MGQEFGLPMLERFAIIIAVWADVVWHPQADLGRWIHAFEHVMDGSHPYDVATLHAIRTWCSLARGDPAQGRQAAHAALDAYEQVGSPWHRLLVRGMALWSAVQLGDDRSADALTAEIRRLAAATNVRVYDLYIAQANAWLALESGSAARLAPCLRELFTRAAVFGTAVPPRFIPAWMPRLAAAALQAHIETPYVRTLIKAYAWPAPGPESVEWPFPVRVRMLGRFEIEMDDLPVCFPSKAPRKTLALLKALVCMGGREVRDHQLIDALWPDEEADAARTVFGVTLHRLRRLLGGLDTIEVSEGCVSINLQRVWVDVIAFERMLSALGGGGGPDAKSVLRALSLYAGPLLPCELDAPWSAAARERLRAKFVHHLALRGRELESHADWDEAIALYLRGLDADSLNESFYQGLMRAYYLSGRRAEGMSLYRRLREALAAALGIEPSMKSQAMFRRMSQSLPLPGAGDGRRNGSTGD